MRGGYGEGWAGPPSRASGSLSPRPCDSGQAVLCCSKKQAPTPGPDNHAGVSCHVSCPWGQPHLKLCQKALVELHNGS